MSNDDRPIAQKPGLADLSTYVVKGPRRDDPDKLFQFYVHGERSKYRYVNLYIKEPNTLAWIESFEPGAIFWDVGANVGVYSIYAALVAKAKVYAFEPESSNYYILNSNIRINQLDSAVFAFCIAFNDATKIDALNIGIAMPGYSNHAFGAPLNDVGEEFVPKFRQQAIGYTADDWIRQFGAEIPHYIKIDVDGIEDKVLCGMSDLLRSPTLLEVQVEMFESRAEYVQSVTKLMNSAGFVLKTVSGSSLVKNYLFSRK